MYLYLYVYMSKTDAISPRQSRPVSNGNDGAIHTQNSKAYHFEGP